MRPSIIPKNMKRMAFLLSMLTWSFASKSQSSDALLARIIWTKNLKECKLFGLVSSCNPKDTSVIMSPERTNFSKKNRRKLQSGATYLFAVEKDIIIGSPSKSLSLLKYYATVLCTNKEPYKFKPRLCTNCIGYYIQ